jgi:hypothetical protein
MFPGSGSNNCCSSASCPSRLFTNSSTELTLKRLNSKSHLAYNLSSRTTQKTQLLKHCNSALALLKIYCLATGTCLPSRCPDTTLLYPYTSRSLLATALHATVSWWNMRKTSFKFCQIHSIWQFWEIFPPTITLWLWVCLKRPIPPKQLFCI